MAETKKTETPKSLPAKKTETSKKKARVKKTERQLMVPIEPFAVPSKDGRPARVISRNTPLWSTDPIVKRHRHLFVTAAESLLGQGQVVHTATAKPGIIAAAPGIDPASYLAGLDDEYE